MSTIKNEEAEINFFRNLSRGPFERFTIWTYLSVTFAGAKVFRENTSNILVTAVAILG